MRILNGDGELFVTIDPGLKGGIAAFLVDYDEYNASLFGYMHMPTAARRLVMSNKDQVAAAQILKMIDHWEQMSHAKVGKIYIEQVGSMPGNAGSKMFTFGVGVGILLGMADARGYEVETISPGKWQNDVHAGRSRSALSKARSLAVVEETFNLKFRKSDDGIADAICLGIHVCHRNNWRVINAI